MILCFKWLFYRLRFCSHNPYKDFCWKQLRFIYRIRSFLNYCFYLYILYFLNGCLVVSPNSCIPVAFQHSSLTYRIRLAKDESSFYETRSLDISINNKAFNRVDRKQLNALKIFLEYLEFYMVAYWKWFSLKVTYQIMFQGLTAAKPMLMKRCNNLQLVKQDRQFPIS